MNKKEIVKKLDEYVKSIDGSFSVCDDEDLSMEYVNGDCIACFDSWKKEHFYICTFDDVEDDKAASLIAETGIIHKFYTKAIELINEMNEEANSENIKQRKLLAVRALEDILLGDLKVKEYQECAGEATLKLEKASEEQCN